jgi:hypothetical protein
MPAGCFAAFVPADVTGQQMSRPFLPRFFPHIVTHHRQPSRRDIPCGNLLPTIIDLSYATRGNSGFSARNPLLFSAFKAIRHGQRSL